MPAQDLYDSLKTMLEEFVATAKQLLGQNQVTVKDLWKFFLKAVNRMVRLAVDLDIETLTPQQVKQAVTEAAMRLYRDVLVVYDVPGVPNWLERMVENNLEPVLEQLVAQTVDYLVDAFWPSADQPAFIAVGPAMLYGADGKPDFVGMLTEDAAYC